MELAKLNAWPSETAEEAFMRCCGSTRWANQMATARPFSNWDEVEAQASAIWRDVEREDVLEAFTHHPEIGADIDKLRQKFAATAGWSAGEQASVAGADEAVLHRLRDGNLAYKLRYGFIFIVCATGKSAAEMLELLESRIDNPAHEEFEIAKGEQMKITLIRLRKMKDE